ncbi:NAD(P)H azoreductase [Xylophilus ampelinus]|nr:NAD(P)H-binding protein [Variovorax sp.]VTY37328.1 NAD(P)H azoreductase [Xylophilus ampelinus]
MYAVTGITGQVGGAVARALLARHQPVRAVVRDAARATPWTDRGADVAVARLDDAQALASAFADTQGVFVMLPANFDPAPGFPEARGLIGAIAQALAQARPARVVALSTIGAQAAQENLLTQLGLLEDALGALPLDVRFIRPAWFMENALWDVAPARDTGVIDAYLQPVERPIPMVATEDVGRTAAEMLLSPGDGPRVVELAGPAPVSPADIAAGLGALLGRPVRAQPVPRAEWEARFRQQGAQRPGPRARMLDGFNEGWLRFEGVARHGTVSLATVLGELVNRAG